MAKNTMGRQRKTTWDRVIVYVDGFVLRRPAEWN